MPGHSTEDRIYVAGHRGLVGSTLCRSLEKRGYENLITISHDELDLRNADGLRRFLRETRPHMAYLCAAKVGGIIANFSQPAEFITDNLKIQTAFIDECYQAGVHEMLFVGSGCIYPRESPQPIREEYLHTGPLEFTNRPYALAKLAGIEMCWAHNRQYGTRYAVALPTNMYGPGDNYDLENGHVVAGLIRRFHEAKMAEAPAISLWGTGRPRRELMYSEDAADACVTVMEHVLGEDGDFFNDTKAPIFNVGINGPDTQVSDLAHLVRSVVGYTGDIQWDHSRPDGTPKKQLESTLLRQLEWRPSMDLEEGLRRTYDAYRATLDNP